MFVQNHGFRLLGMQAHCVCVAPARPIDYLSRFPKGIKRICFFVDFSICNMTQKACILTGLRALDICGSIQ